MVISIKAGFDFQTMSPLGSPEDIRREVEETISQLGGTKSLDLFELARLDPNRPVEQCMRVLKQLIDEGKLAGVTLSEVGPDTIRRAAKCIPIHGVEVEFSLFERSILDNGVAATCAELDIPIIAYSPLARGWLTGKIKSLADVSNALSPRFSAENFDANRKLAVQVEAFASKKGYTTGQVALGWIVGQSRRNGNPEIIPIPGGTTSEKVQENTTLIELTEEELAEIDEFVKKFEVQGARYPPFLEHFNFAETVEES